MQYRKFEGPAIAMWVMKITVRKIENVGRALKKTFKVWTSRPA